MKAPEVRNVVDDIIRYENGDMEPEEIVAMFQALVDAGTAWTLQGHYGRTAEALIKQGLVERCTCHLRGALSCPRHGP